jgi:hypothetical protein
MKSKVREGNGKDKVPIVGVFQGVAKERYQRQKV